VAVDVVAVGAVALVPFVLVVVFAAVADVTVAVAVDVVAVGAVDDGLGFEYRIAKLM